MQTGKNSIIEARIHHYSNLYTCSKIQVYDVMVEYNNSSIPGVANMLIAIDWSIAKCQLIDRPDFTLNRQDT